MLLDPAAPPLLLGADAKPGFEIVESMDELIDVMDKVGKKRWLVNHLARGASQEIQAKAETNELDPDAAKSMMESQTEPDIQTSPALEPDRAAPTKRAESGERHARIIGSP